MQEVVAHSSDSRMDFVVIARFVFYCTYDKFVSHRFNRFWARVVVLCMSDGGENQALTIFVIDHHHASYSVLRNCKFLNQ